MSLVSAILMGLLACALLAAPPADAAIIFVDDNTCPAAGAGTPVSPYCSIRTAICAAVAGDVVSVADGTYNLAVRMKPGVSLISQNGPLVTIIDAAGQPCTLGDYCGVQTMPLQCAAVTFSEGHTPSDVLDGFTIRGGAGRILTESVDGGGIYVFSSPTIRNNIITNNVLSGPLPQGRILRGAGVYVATGAPVIRDNTISSNIARPGPGTVDPNGTVTSSQGYGGGLWVGFFSAPIVIDNLIQNNVAGDPNVANSLGAGGGLVIYPGNANGPLIDRNVIADNDSDTTGGGISVLSAVGNTAVARITNNVIVGNSGRSGGGVYTYFSSVDLFNNTIVANDALRGAGIYHGETSTFRTVRIVNNIIRSNVHRQFGDGGGIYWVVDQDPNVVPSISFNIISANQSNQCAGEISGATCSGANGNMNVDPLFANPAMRNYHIAPPSPAIDQANATGAPALDHDIRARGFNGAGSVNMPRVGDVDIGAFEYSPCTIGVDPCNGADDDCDGQTDEGFNVGSACDGVGQCGAGVFECTSSGGVRCSTDPGGSMSQVATETCNSLDDDCDGAIDDGFNVGGACDGTGQCGAGTYECNGAGTATCSTDPGGSQSQAVAETCDTLDNDCDGLIDDGFNAGQTCDGVGACGIGVFECSGPATTRCSTDVGGSQSQATTELCDGIDNDCDGTPDDGFNLGQSCDGVGPCGAGVRECSGPAATRCSTDAGGSQSQATTELCDGIDNDCDGTPDDGFNLGQSCDGVGACGAGIRECNGMGGGRCSTDAGGSQSEAGTETCNGLDDDCDGVTDEFVSNACGTCGPLPPDDTCNALDDNCNGIVDEGCCTSVSATAADHVAAGRAHAETESCGSTTVFTENFEAASIPAPPWILVGTPTTTTSNVIAGTRSGHLQGSDEIQRDLDTLGLTGVTISYQRNSGSQETGDIFVMRYSTNGGSSWTNLESVDGAFGLTSRNFALPLNSNLRISFRNNGNSTTGDNVYLDNVTVGYPCETTTYLANGSNDNMGMNPSAVFVLRNQPIGSGTWRIGDCLVCGATDLTCDGFDDDCNGIVDDGQAERCDGIDNDCNGTTDDGFFIGAACDGVGPCGAGTTECRTFETTRCSTDFGGSQSEAMAETCNGADDDCDGQIDNGLPAGSPCDGVGQCGTGVFECDGAGGLRCSTDTGGSSSQAVPEICNGVDDDCDGSADEDFLDSDGDLLADCTDPDDDNDESPDLADCAPLDSTTFGLPGPVAGVAITVASPTTLVFTPQNIGTSTRYEVVSGLVRRIGATAGFTESFCVATPVASSPWNDGRPAPPVGDMWFYLVRAFNNCGEGSFGTALRNAGAGDVCKHMIFDLDSDGSPSDLDCDDTNPLIAPSNLEICDGLDNTCDMIVDEGNPGGGGLCGAPLTGECDPGSWVCSGGGLVCVDFIGPAPELCDGLDNDCDDIIDNNVVDSDNDGLHDCIDADDDGDMVDDLDDCAPLDEGAFAVPTVMSEIQVLDSNPTGISWDPLEVGVATVYDIATGPIPGPGFAGGTCLMSIASPPALDLREDPFPGNFYYYMIRARNNCGAASYGSLERDTHPGCP